MATIKLNADATQAKKEIDDVSKKLRKLGKEGEKPIRTNVKPSVGRGRGAGVPGGAAPGIPIKPTVRPGAGITGAGNTIGQVGGALGVGAAGAMGKGMGAIGQIAAGAALGGAIGALASAAVQFVASIGDWKYITESFSKAAAAATDPQSVMRRRAGNMDTLADKARSNGATLAEQFATDEARQNVFGATGASMFSKMDQSIQAAYAGDTKAGAALGYFGITAQDLNGKSSLEQQDMIIRAIAEGFAKVDSIQDPAERARAEAELFNAAKDLVGAKNMMQVRTFAGGWQDYAQQKSTYINDWQRKVGGNTEARLLSAASQAEYYETQGRLEGYRAPARLEGYAIEKGQDTLSAAIAETKGLSTRTSLTNSYNKNNRAVRMDPVYQSTLDSINRNTARNNQLMENLLNRQPAQPTKSDTSATPTYS